MLIAHDLSLNEEGSIPYDLFVQPVSVIPRKGSPVEDSARGVASNPRHPNRLTEQAIENLSKRADDDDFVDPSLWGHLVGSKSKQSFYEDPNLSNQQIDNPSRTGKGRFITLKIFRTIRSSA
ncbi:hypothetical protein RF11_07435 [Thelohanellus kitauei]|uniref:Uncharacterized protein n=1 Tax=Thelohanellus kitauei TaxID=669202 RepID=A0A0C2JZ52_THEKT|nr:hypothetical protein RF11_07435 [Thelohanellus kitauei]